MKNKVEYVIRLGPVDRYRHKHIREKGRVIYFSLLFIHDYNDALTFAESDLKANWEIYKERFLRGE